jgi:4-oxalocrotonate tautomerase
MPHVIVKMYPGRTEEQKARLTARIVEDLVTTIGSQERSVSVAIQEVVPDEWAEKAYRPDIADRWGELYKKPGYDPGASGREPAR